MTLKVQITDEFTAEVALPPATPAGGNGLLQYNNAGSFAGAAALTYTTSGALLTMSALAATDKPLIVKGASSQSADLTQWQDSSATVLARITAAGRLQVGDGTVSLPAFAFTSDTDCGLYRIGANNIGVAVGGVKAIDIATTAVGLPASYYLNFGATLGTSGYGIRDNGGTMEFKNSGGTWAGPGGSPGGSNTQLQYNNSGAFGGTTALTYATSGALLTTTAQAATDKPLIVKAAAAQSADLTQWQDSSATVLTRITAAGRMQGADGTVSLPAYTFQADINTGIYRIGADNIGVTAGGTKALDIAATYTSLPASYYLNFGATTGTMGYGFRDNAGAMEFKNSGGPWTTIGSGGGGSGSPGGANGSLQFNDAGNFGGAVGITYAASGTIFKTEAQVATDTAIVVKGATSQSADLQEWQNSAGTTLVTIDKDGNYIGAAISTGLGLSTGAASIELGAFRTGNGLSYIDFHSTPSTDCEFRIIRNGGTNGDASISNLGTGLFSLDTNGSSVITMTSAGRVGIGTTSPGDVLAVNGSIALTSGGFLGFTGNTTLSTSNYALLGDATTTILNVGTGGIIDVRVNNSSALRVDPSRNVGIGTATPQGLFHVVAGTNDSLLVRGHLNLADGCSLYSVNAANSTGKGMEINASPIALLGGSVGINTVAPNAQLHVIGANSVNSLLVAGATKGIRFIHDTLGSYIDSVDAGSTVYQPLQVNGSTLTLATGAGSRVFIDATGHVGIGTSSPAYQLDATGNANVQSGLRLGIGANVGGFSRGALQTAFNLDNTGASAFMWNYTNSGGELDLMINRDGGSFGGLAIWDFPNSSGDPNLTFQLFGSGAVRMPFYSGPGTLGTVASGVLTIGGFVTPQMYGCVGDGVTDDTANLSTCLNSGKPVHLVGKFKIMSQITVTLNRTSGPFGLYIQGMGEEASQIYLGATGANIAVGVSYSDSNADSNTQVILKDFNISPRVANVSVGLQLLGSPNIGSVADNYSIHNVSVVPAAGAYALTGFYLQDVRNGLVDDCHIVGSSSLGSGMVFTSTDNGTTGNAPVDVNFRSVHITFFDKGIELRPSGSTTQYRSNEWQGVNITNSIILVCNYGIYATGTEDTAAGLYIGFNEFNAQIAGVFTQNVKGITVMGNGFQANDNNCNCVDIRMNVGLGTPDYCRSMVMGNRMIGAGHTGVVAVVTTGASFSGNMVSGNLAQGCTGGFVNSGAGDSFSNNVSY